MTDPRLGRRPRTVPPTSTRIDVGEPGGHSIPAGFEPEPDVEAPGGVLHERDCRAHVKLPPDGPSVFKPSSAR